MVEELKPEVTYFAFYFLFIKNVLCLQLQVYRIISDTKSTALFLVSLFWFMLMLNDPHVGDFEMFVRFCYEKE
jgi:hypothetical protein